ncbi:bifunctional enzyme CysN/CysC [Rhodoblastus acidophilus]|uniref:Multifunctional fusion protein n=1 Tax=Rhodoblastus acidophilus TaxID=1074 RepID=A0A212R119_RHOAC|nr:sulfate adenylyltransferase subunit CysN [Rhodoblastus acidophilus]PPQ40409.1 bifunctional sulfate adenylyltransferase subunit 1/adenylylsulfate kinase [Rhodoblastus acidophilus]RAI19153.1 bifunctional sulfate adenylyltransferase subunit 1/adenylylsulfate kinase [Rhodoblastus acidophilus]SNB65701.1 bifunctional enzyme CysN/CysC [Rhodoblastus acidophilus]
MAPPALRFLTCGSVDDGKSTLIGRLLYERSLICDDQLANLERDSKKFGTTGAAVDFALLVDGLEAEREQGITIDVAYRYFSTDKRSFIVADCPGHEQYTRNMATGASHCDLAVLLVDARKGLLAQTHRHANIVALLGVRHVVLAVNKMDLVDYDRAAFARIVAQFEAARAALNFLSVTPIPLSARHGDNVCRPSANMPWHDGPDLLGFLETVDVEDRAARPLRFPVQWVNRPDADFRGLAGTLASGCVAKGDEIVVAASGGRSRVARIVAMGGDLDRAEAPDSVTLVFADEIDASRGDLLCDPRHRPEVADQFAADLIWMSEEALYPGRSYLLKCGGNCLPASVTEIKYRLDVETQAQIAAKKLGLNEIGFCNLALSRPIAFDAYADNRVTGGFILIDRATHGVAAAGVIRFALRRAQNVHPQALSLDKARRAALKRQKPALLWFTGLSGAGKSTIANLVEVALARRGVHTALLDGDNVRHGLNKDLGFTEADRVENIRRVGEVAKLMLDAGLIVLCAFISPFAAERRMARELVARDEFVEIFIDTPLATCIARDPKGLYQKALAGQIKNFTGVDQAYERPEAADIVIGADCVEAQQAADRIVGWLDARGFLAPD